MPDFPITTDSKSLLNDATDILNELHNRQWLLECLDRTLTTVYYDADSKARAGLDKIATVLYAYDNDRVTERLRAAIALLSEAV